MNFTPLQKEVHLANTSEFKEFSPSNMYLTLAVNQTIVDIVIVLALIGLIASASGVIEVSARTAIHLQVFFYISAVVLTLRLPTVMIKHAVKSSVQSALSSMSSDQPSE